MGAPSGAARLWRRGMGVRMGVSQAMSAGAAGSTVGMCGQAVCGANKRMHRGGARSCAAGEVGAQVQASGGALRCRAWGVPRRSRALRVPGSPAPRPTRHQCPGAAAWRGLACGGAHTEAGRRGLAAAGVGLAGSSAPCSRPAGSIRAQPPDSRSPAVHSLAEAGQLGGAGGGQRALAQAAGGAGALAALLARPRQARGPARALEQRQQPQAAGLV